jgi:hypothetical protein
MHIPRLRLISSHLVSSISFLLLRYRQISKIGSEVCGNGNHGLRFGVVLQFVRWRMAAEMLDVDGDLGKGLGHGCDAGRIGRVWRARIEAWPFVDVIVGVLRLVEIMLGEIGIVIDVEICGL